MDLPYHIILEHIIPCMEPKDQWAIASTCKKLNKEFLNKNPTFIDDYDVTKCTVKRLKSIGDFLKKKRARAGLVLFNVHNCTTFTVKKWIGTNMLYYYERSKGKCIYPKYFKTDNEALRFFEENILEDLLAGKLRIIITDPFANIKDKLEFKSLVDNFEKLIKI